MPRILIADDHEMVRRGIRSLLETREDFEVSEACNGREAVDKALELKPDLVILDVSMPILDGFGAAREIKRLVPGTAILILTFQKTNAFAEVARKMGVSGYFSKDEAGHTLLRAIDTAIQDRDGLNCSFAAIARPSGNPDEIQSQPQGKAAISSLRILLLHSRVAYIERCLLEFDDLQFQVQCDVVLTAEHCAERLRLRHYDIVLAEYPVPQWQSTPTLEMLRRTQKHIPLILVTDNLDRESVAELLTKGAADCVDVSKLDYLPIAIRRALKENTLHWERKRIEKQLKSSEANYRALAGNLAFGICRCGTEGEFLDVNQTLVAMLGYASREELMGVNLASTILRDPLKRTQLLGEKAERGWSDPLETEWKKKDGGNVQVRLSGREVSSDDERKKGYEIIVEDITKQRNMEEHLREQADRDPLTGLANYRFLVAALNHEIRRSKRTGREFAILLFDLDRLKQINDRHGHLTGSEALCRLANVLIVGCRNIDIAARFGGDEFVVILPETGIEPAKLAAKRLCESLANDGLGPKLSASVGVAVYPRDGEAIETLLSVADAALYGMKGSDTFLSGSNSGRLNDLIRSK